MVNKVAVGLSGGVDSAVAAYLLKKRGFDISGVYLHCFDEDAPGCRGRQDRKDAVKVALHLKIPFQVLDFRNQYKAAVIGYFKKEYLAGRTPNPDVVCNRDIKFGLFLDWAIKSSFDYVATGHYAKLAPNTTIDDRRWKIGIEDRKSKIEKSNPSSTFNLLPPSSTFYHPSSSDLYLCQPKDLHKDQTYFLWAVPRHKFRRVLFPLADITKKDVRSVARLSKIPVAAKPDSTGICFIGEVRVGDFLKSLGVKEKVGEVVISVKDYNNYKNYKSYGYQVIGRHRGVWFYTIGQRHGFDVTARIPNSDYSEFSIQNSVFSDRPPLYVISKDVKTNRLVVGFGAECYRDSFEIAECNWLIANRYSLTAARSRFTVNGSRFTAYHCFVRIRHLGSLIPCALIANRYSLTAARSRFTVNGSRLTVRLKEPQRGLAPGQSAVFYDKNGVVLGGGVIQ